mgnify:CR=1 FL=1
MCEMNDVLEFPEHWECVTYGHEWKREPKPAGARVVKDAFGNVLVAGDCVTLIKDLPLKGFIPSPQRRDEVKTHPHRRW